ncbi:protein trichome birefringence-like 14 [Iris pallida]|uniref:Protein trichome birefringence-like 14 n=1 Tax=Iris pallida TaxID=29817 RepID=A0AAX6E1C7_IRIPA|nr:protein trichome birefringence-like 14 [Iris pallida]
MKGTSSYILGSNKLSLTLIALICTTLAIWVWEKTPLLGPLFPPSDQFNMHSSMISPVVLAETIDISSGYTHQQPSSKEVPSESSSKEVLSESSSKDVPLGSFLEEVPPESSSKEVPLESSSKEVLLESSSKEVQLASSLKEVPLESSKEEAPSGISTEEIVSCLGKPVD